MKNIVSKCFSYYNISVLYIKNDILFIGKAIDFAFIVTTEEQKMKIKATFKTDKIPLGYRIMFVSLIKNLLNNYSENYFNELYMPKEGVIRKTKNFTFSVFMKDFKRQGDVFLTDEVTLNISSPDKEFISLLYNLLLNIKDYEFKGKYKIYKKSVKMVDHKKINSDSCKFRTMSPIAIKDESGRFLNIEDSHYCEMLNYIINKSLFNYRGRGLSRKIEFTPIDFKKVVVKEKIASFTKKTGRDYMHINSYAGVFILKGDK